MLLSVLLSSDKVSALVEDARAQGCEVLCGGGRREGSRGFFYEPTIVSNIKEGVRLFDEAQLRQTSDSHTLRRDGILMGFWDMHTQQQQHVHDMLMHMHMHMHMLHAHAPARSWREGSSIRPLTTPRRCPTQEQFGPVMPITPYK